MGEPDRDCSCKLGRTASRYGLTELADRLDSAWLEDGSSLRGLEERFNAAVVRAAIEETEAPPLEGEAENVYRLLTDGGVSSGMRTQARRRLAQRGVAVDELESALVSYQTVNRHLKRCLGAERPADDGDVVDRCSDRVLALQSRTAAVAADALAQVRDADAIDLGEFDVFVDVGVTCRECGYHGTVDAVLEEGCRC